MRQAGATLHCGARASHCRGLLRSTGSRRAGSVVVAHGPSCSTACGIFPDQGSNPCPLHWQADSQPLRHQGSPQHSFLNSILQPFESTWRSMGAEFTRVLYTFGYNISYFWKVFPSPFFILQATTYFSRPSSSITFLYEILPALK